MPTGACCCSDLELPDWTDYTVRGRRRRAPRCTRRRACWASTSATSSGATRANFRLFGPDETASNRLQDVFEVTDRAWNGETLAGDDHLAPDGRVLEVLSEHLCQGWLEGYLLTGRHGLFNCYEAFIHIVDSMFNQHAKWLESARDIPWRRSVASLTYLLSSHVWRQDHNGFSHQDPGFIDLVVNKQASVIRVYLPPDANCLLSVADHCLRSRDYVNVIVAGKQPNMTGCRRTRPWCTAPGGSGCGTSPRTTRGRSPTWSWRAAAMSPPSRPLAAVDLLRRHLPDLRVRVVNVVDLMRLQPDSEHPHGMTDREFDTMFTTDRPVIFAFHGYPTLIHRLTYRRTNHDNIHVRGYKERGTTTTPFDMVMLNDLDRFHLVIDVLDRVPGLEVPDRRAAPADGRRPPRGPSLHPGARRGPTRDRRVALAGLTPAAGGDGYVLAVGVRAAVWDLGSSSFHLLVCEAGPGRSLTPVLHRRALLNLGLSVGARGSIPRDRVAASVAAAKRLRAGLAEATGRDRRGGGHRGTARRGQQHRGRRAPRAGGGHQSARPRRGGGGPAVLHRPTRRGVDGAGSVARHGPGRRQPRGRRGRRPSRARGHQRARSGRPGCAASSGPATRCRWQTARSAGRARPRPWRPIGPGRRPATRGWPNGPS